MASDFTTSCQEILMKELRIGCPNFEWGTAKRFSSSGKGWSWVEIDIFGESAGLIACIEFEMHRRRPESNAVKLFELLEGSRGVYPFAGNKNFDYSHFLPILRS